MTQGASGKDQGGGKKARRAFQSTTSPGKLKAAERQRKALELRAGGKPLFDIAKELGYANHSCVQKALKAIAKRLDHEAGDYARALEHERLDALLAANWPDALKGDRAAGDLALKVERERIQLEGLRRPILIAPVTPEGRTYGENLTMEQRILDARALLRALEDLAASPADDVVHGASPEDEEFSEPTEDNTA